MGEVKVMIGLRRRDDVPQAEMHSAWEQQHGPAMAAAFKPLRYAITTFVGREGRTPPAFDGIEELWYADRAAAEAALGAQFNTDRPLAAAGDEAFLGMLDANRCFRLLTTEVIPVNDAPVSRDNEKTVLFVRRLETVEPKHFFDEWRDNHAANVAAGFQGQDGAMRYVVTLADENGARGAFDGFPVFWWRDSAARSAPRDPNAGGGSGAVTDDGFDELCAVGTLRLIGHEFYVVK